MATATAEALVAVTEDELCKAIFAFQACVHDAFSNINVCVTSFIHFLWDTHTCILTCTSFLRVRVEKIQVCASHHKLNANSFSVLVNFKSYMQNQNK